jgi:hypothetical protein
MFIDTSSKKLRLAHTRYWMDRGLPAANLRKSQVDWTSVAPTKTHQGLMMLFKMRTRFSLARA